MARPAGSASSYRSTWTSWSSHLRDLVADARRRRRRAARRSLERTSSCNPGLERRPLARARDCWRTRSSPASTSRAARRRSPAIRDGAGLARRACGASTSCASLSSRSRGSCSTARGRTSGSSTSCLYDGGFDSSTSVSTGSLRERARTRPSTRGARRYPWLFGDDNNYDWYRPRDEALVEVLYALLPVPARHARRRRPRRPLRVLRRRDRPRPARPVLHAPSGRALHARPRRLRRARGVFRLEGDDARRGGARLRHRFRRLPRRGGAPRDRRRRSDLGDAGDLATGSPRSSPGFTAARSARFRTT